MDENAVRALLGQLADSAGPASSVDVEKARRVGRRRLRLRRVGAPTASVSAVAVVVGLVANGALPGTGSWIGAPGPQPTVRLSNAEVAVLTNSAGTPRAVMAADHAVQVIAKQCMKARGLRYYLSFQAPVVPGFSGHGIPLHGFPGLAGVPQAPIGLAAREADGYGFNHKEAGGGPSKEARYADSAGKRYVLALDGPAGQRVPWTLFGGMSGSIPSGGCLGVAERQVYGSIANYILATTGRSLLTDALLSAVTADPKFTAVVSRWSSCMARRGFTYHSPEELWNDLANTPSQRALEIRTAVADYRCAVAVRLLPTVETLQIHHARYFSKALAPYLVRLVGVDARALRVARALHIRLPRT